MTGAFVMTWAFATGDERGLAGVCAAVVVAVAKVKIAARRRRAAGDDRGTGAGQAVCRGMRAGRGRPRGAIIGRARGEFVLSDPVRKRPVGTTIGRICTAKLPDPALHSGSVAPGSVGTAIGRMKRKKQDTAR